MMDDYEREQRREVERRERVERETIEPMDEPIGVYDRGERVHDPVMGRVDVDPMEERTDVYDTPATAGSSSGLWMTVGIIVLVVVALIVVMLLLPLL
jgi:hypothetical protein